MVKIVGKYVCQNETSGQQEFATELSDNNNRSLPCSRSISAGLEFLSSATLRESVSEVEKAEQSSGRCTVHHRKLCFAPLCSAKVHRYKDAVCAAW